MKSVRPGKQVGRDSASEREIADEISEKLIAAGKAQRRDELERRSAASHRRHRDDCGGGSRHGRALEVAMGAFSQRSKPGSVRVSGRERMGIDGRSLQAWKITFERGRPRVPRARPSPKPRTVVSPPRGDRAQEVGRPSQCSLRARRARRARLEFGDDVSSDTLRSVLAVLRACCASRRWCESSS